MIMTDEGQLSCMECGFITSKGKRLVKHMRKSHGLQAAKCPWCLAIHYSRGIMDLCIHKKHQHRPVRLRCFLCKFSSRSLSRWAGHMAQFHRRQTPALIRLSSLDQTCSSEFLPADREPFTTVHSHQVKQRHQNNFHPKTSETSGCKKQSSFSHSVIDQVPKADFNFSGIDLFINNRADVDIAGDNKYNGQIVGTSIGNYKCDNSALIKSETNSPNQLSFSQNHFINFFENYKDQKDKNETAGSSIQHHQVDGGPMLPDSSFISCPYCEHSYCSIKELRHHCKAEHAQDSKYPCKQCNYLAVSISKLVRHMTTHNKSTESRTPVPCPYCAMTFSSLQALGRHCNEIHQQGLPYKCEHCTYSTKWLYLLVRHMRIHTQDKPYACQLCSYRVCHYIDLYRHMRMHRNERPYACSVCSERFIQPQHLARHIRFHTQEKPYSCQDCFKLFSSSHSLKAHLANGVCTKYFHFRKLKKSF